jgi:flavin reductase (DIM6/NTAB) family NADH-FMN oxidoreductase RutF
VSTPFSRLMLRLDYPMFIVTTPAREGCLIGFATQASIDPERFLACISKANRTYRSLGDFVAVHLVTESAADLAELFGGETGDDVDKFSLCEWTPGPEGLPLLDGCPNRFCGRVVQRLDCGDHLALLLEPFAVELADGDDQLPFRRAKAIEPGHPP